MTLWTLLFRKSVKVFQSLPDMPFYLSFHTCSNAFDIPEVLPLFQSYHEIIYNFVSDGNKLMHKYSVLKPD